MLILIFIFIVLIIMLEFALDKMWHAHEKKEMIVCFLSAFVTITICSKSSPLYPLNDWVDPNCIFTVGKSMLSGVVPYKDLVEQKGPLLYMLHAFAALISYKTFLGVYFIEILACFMFLLLCRDILKLYSSESSLLCIPVISAVVYSAVSFQGGDSAEELCLPMIACCLYLGLKSFKEKKDITVVQGVCIGITSACVLWIKFNLLGFYIGWFIAYLIICVHDKAFKTLIKTLLSITVGVVVLSLPILLYFAVNNALEDMLTVYFFDNLFSYAAASQKTRIWDILYDIYQGYWSAWAKSPLTLLIVYAGIIGTAWIGRRKDFLSIILSFFGAFFFIYFGEKRYAYYSFIFSAFIPMGLAAFENCALKCREILKNKDEARQLLSICVIGFSFFFMYFKCSNIYLMGTDKSSMPQYKFAEIILQEDDPSLLNYGFLDGGFYTVTGIVPNCPYFCKLNLSKSEMMETQKNYVDEGMVDFVVTRDLELDTELYVCVSEADFYFEGKNRKYRLYQLKTENQ